MKNALKQFKFLGVIGWIEALFSAFLIFQAVVGVWQNHPLDAFLPLVVSIPFAFCAYVSFSAAGQVRRLPFLPWFLILSGLFNFACGVLAGFATDQGKWLYLFIFMAVGNLFAAQARPSISPPKDGGPVDGDTLDSTLTDA